MAVDGIPMGYRHGGDENFVDRLKRLGSDQQNHAALVHSQLGIFIVESTSTI
jgi:hypothetical protein